MFVALMGMSDGSQIIMARRIGEQKENLLAQIFGTTLFTNLIIASLLFFIIQLFIPELIYDVTRHTDIAIGEVDFVQIRSYSLFFAVVSLAINELWLIGNGTKGRSLRFNDCRRDWNVVSIYCVVL